VNEKDKLSSFVDFSLVTSDLGEDGPKEITAKIEDPA
jgi:hypothetical protein